MLPNQKKLGHTDIRWRKKRKLGWSGLEDGFVFEKEGGELALRSQQEDQDVREEGELGWSEIVDGIRDPIPVGAVKDIERFQARARPRWRQAVQDLEGKKGEMAGLSQLTEYGSKIR